MEIDPCDGDLMSSDSSERGSFFRGGALAFQKGQEMRGYALVMAVVFVFLLTLFGLAFFQLAETDVDLVGDNRNAMEAAYAAHGGLEKVRWILKHHTTLRRGDGSLFPNLNPFSPAFYAGGYLSDFQQVAHDNPGILSPGGFELPRYFRINLVDGRAGDPANPVLLTGVRVQVLGALDVDGDGEAGLEHTDSESFYVDRDDVNRKFEAIIALPGSLGEDLSAGAPVFYDESGVEIAGFSEEMGRLITQDGYDVPGASGYFYWQRDDSLPGWDRYDYVFGRPIRQGQIELPPGLFDGNGTPRLAYFSDLDPRQYQGNQVFDRDNDPTRGIDGRSTVYVDGDVTIRGVDFGYLDNNGNLRGGDWQETDVTLIATGTLTARNIQSGNVGRLTLIAPSILLVGDYDTRINGIALASDTLTLDDQETSGDPHGCPYGVLKGENPSAPLRYAAYFMGTMIAGTSINLRNSGWTVLFDEKVINGLMHDTILSKPTMVYEDGEDVNFPNDWIEVDGEIGTQQETYTAEEISAGDGASWDQGGDGWPNVMRIVHSPVWSPTDDCHDYGIEDQLELDFEDIGIGLQDWSNYRALTFWMSLDNYRRVSGLRETLRMFYFRVRLVDNANEDAFFGLSSTGFHLSRYHSAYDSIENPGDGVWKRVRIPLTEIDPTRPFNITIVDEIRILLDDFTLSWYSSSGAKEWISYDPSGDAYGQQGKFVFHTGGNQYPVRFEKTSDNRHRLRYTDAGGGDRIIQWNPDPSTTTMYDLYFEDQFNPAMRIDQIQVPGKPASNAYLEYGLPRSLHYAVTHLEEYETF